MPILDNPMAQDAPRRDPTAATQFLCGFAGGFCAKFVEHPLDTVKVRMQFAATPFRSPLDCAATIVRQSGVRGLYRGLGAPVGGAALENAVAFATFGAAGNYCRSRGWTEPPRVLLAHDDAATRIGSDEGPPPPLALTAVAFCGGFAGLFTCLILTPVEYVKCRVQTGVDPTIAECLRRAWHAPTEHGGARDRLQRSRPIAVLRRFYSGFLPTMGREVCGNAAWFATFRVVSSFLQPDEARRVLWQNALSGAAAGVMYWSVLYPADTIKTRMQTASKPCSGAAEVGRRGKPTILSVGRDIVREGGIRALYRGWTTTVMRAAPANAVIFSVYNACEKWILGQQRKGVHDRTTSHRN